MEFEETILLDMEDDKGESKGLPLTKDVNTVDKVKKRRSSIFQNKSTAPENNGNDAIAKTEGCEENGATSNGNTAVIEQEHEGDKNESESSSELLVASENNEDEKEFDLAQYVKNMIEERSLWIQIKKERKDEARKLLKQKIALESKGQPLNLSILSDEERAFLSAAPNYQELANQCNQLASEAARIGFLNHTICQQSEELISRMTKALDRTTKQVILKSEK